MQPEHLEISTGRRELRGHQGVSGAPLGSGGTLLMGLPFLGMGLYASLGVSGRIPGFSISRGVPPFVVEAVGWVFALVGTWLMAGGLRGLVRAARRRRLAAEHPEQPWFADWQGDPQLARDATWPRIRASCFGMAVFLLMIGILNAFAFGPEHGGLPLQALAVGTDLLAAWGLARLVLMILRALRFGAAEVRYGAFPLHLGEELHLEIRLPCDLRLLETLTVTLRSIEERFETRGHGRQRSTQVVCYETWSATLRPPDPAALADLDGTFTVGFEPPADESPTNLTARPATFWELEVAATRPGLDLSSTWLVPVYGPREGAEAPDRTRTAHEIPVAG